MTTRKPIVQVNGVLSELPSGDGMKLDGPVGIGMTPVNILDITQNNNAAAKVSLLNNSTGAGAIAYYSATNGTNYLNMAMFGTGYASSGVTRQDGGYIAARGAGGLTLTTESANPIYFGINSAEVGRFGADGSFNVGGSASLGAATIGASKGRLGTSSTIITAGEILTVDASSVAGAFRNNSATAPVVGFWNQASGNSNLVYLYSGGGGGTLVGSITTNGTTIAVTGTSDGSLKMNAVALDPGALFDQLEMWEGDWIFASGESFRGPIAQDLHKLRPQAVTPGDDTLQPWQPGYKPWMVDLTKLLPDVFAELKSLRARVAELESRLPASS